MKKRSKILIFLLILFTLFTLFRIDYRFKTTVECCSDDYDYFLHASTVAFDFDLDYSNQDVRGFSYYKNGKNTPIGFIGSGIFSSPFLYIGKLLSSIANEDTTKDILNLQLLLYSLSSIFYLFASFYFMARTLHIYGINFNKYDLLLFMFSSGVLYFAFERFSMTHAYEHFTTTLLIFLISSFYINKENNNFLAFLIPIFLLLGYLTRMSNIYLFLLPILIKELVKKKNKITNKSLIKNRYFILSSFLSILIFSYISDQLYGEIIINPQKIYGSNIEVSNVILGENLNIFDFAIGFTKTILITNFSLEFGLFWVSPILFLPFLHAFYALKKKHFLIFFIILFCFLQNFFIVHLWQALGSSYGFRYLFSLVPLGILLYYNLQKSKFETYYLRAFSFFGLTSIIFFEASSFTQLSLVDQTNSFGRVIRYSNPTHVTGIIKSLFELNSYLIIFTTSLLGVVLFKFLLSVMKLEALNTFLANLGLPVENSDFQNYLLNLNQVELYKILLIIAILTYFAYYVVYKFEKKLD